MSPRSRGRKPKKSGKSKRTDKRPSPAAGRATAVDPGYSGLSIELPRSPLDDVLLRHVRPDRFGPSHRRVLDRVRCAAPGRRPPGAGTGHRRAYRRRTQEPRSPGPAVRSVGARSHRERPQPGAVRRRLEQRHLAGAMVAAARARLDRLIRPWRVRRAAGRGSREVPAACSAGAAAGLAGVDAGHRGDR